MSNQSLSSGRNENMGLLYNESLEAVNSSCTFSETSLEQQTIEGAGSISPFDSAPPPLDEVQLREERRTTCARRRSSADDSLVMLKIVQERLEHFGEGHDQEQEAIAPEARSVLPFARAASPNTSCFLRITPPVPVSDEGLKEGERFSIQDYESSLAAREASKAGGIVGAVAVSSRNSFAATANTEILESSANWTCASEEGNGNTDAEALAIAAEVAPELLDLERTITERVRGEILEESIRRRSDVDSINVPVVAEVVEVYSGHKQRVFLKGMICCAFVPLIMAVGITAGILTSRDRDGNNASDNLEAVFPSDDTIIANAPETICYERIPHQGLSEICSPQEQGSGVTQLVAASRLWNAPTAQISIANAGEVRVDIPQGKFTMDQAWELLPYYDNELVLIHLKGNKLVNAMERGIQKLFDDKVASGTSLNSTTPSGAFPYGAGIRWTVAMTNSFPHRLLNIEVNPRLSGDWEPIDLHMTYTVVTSSYLAAGGDSYHEFSSAEEEHVIHTGLFSLESFVKYAETQKLLVEPPLETFSTQTYIHNPVLFEIAPEFGGYNPTDTGNASSRLL